MINLKLNDSIEFNGREFLFQSRSSTGLLSFNAVEGGQVLQIIDPETLVQRLPDEKWLEAEMAAKRIEFRGTTFAGKTQQLRRSMQRSNDELKVMDPTIEGRLQIVRYMDANGVKMSDAKIGEALDAICTQEWVAQFGPRPGKSTVRRWMAQRGRPKDRRLRDMLRMTGRTKRATRLHVTVDSIVNHYVLRFFSETGLSMTACWECALNDINRVNEGRLTTFGESFPRPDEPFNGPSFETFRKRVRAATSPETYAAKFGDQARNSRARGAGRALTASRALEIVLADTWELPNIFGNAKGAALGSAHLTLFQDLYSRAVVAWILEPMAPTTATISELMVRLGLKKEVSPTFTRVTGLSGLYGKPSKILFDNALCQSARAIEDAAVDIGIEIQFAGAKQPRHKAVLERTFGSLKSYVFANVKNAKLDAKRAREFEQDPASGRVVAFKELHGLMAIAIDFYNTRHHGGLNDRTPLAAFEQSVAEHGKDLFADLDRVKDCVGGVEFERSLTKSGVTVFGMRYGGHDEVDALLTDLMRHMRRGTQNPTISVKVKSDDRDIGYIRVWNDTTKRYVRLTNQTVDQPHGVPLWLHQMEIEALTAGGTTKRSKDSVAFRAAVLEAANDVHPDAMDETMRKHAKLAQSVNVQKALGSRIPIFTNTSDFVGDLNAIPHEVAAPTREDTFVVPRRPARRGDDGDDGGRDRRDAGSGKASRARRSSRRDAGRDGYEPPRPTDKADWADFG